MPRLLPGISILTALLLVAAGSEAADARSRGGVVILNGVPVLEFRAPTGSETQGTLAADAARALRFADASDEVRVKTDGADWKVVVGTATVVLVTDTEARSHHTGGQHLAEAWASTIRDALSLPPLKFSTDFVRAPLGTSQTLGLVGSSASGATVQSSDSRIVAVRKDAGGVEVRFVGVGDAQIQARGGNDQQTINVSVRPYAAVLPQSFVAEVTGSPAAQSTVAGAVAGCLKGRLTELPTATCSFAPVKAEPLAAGAWATYSVHAHVRAPDSFDGVGDVTVKVHNLVMPEAKAGQLWLSNSPESVHQLGPLFSSSLKQGTSARFMYHHVDMSTQPVIIRVEAVNDTDEPAKVSVMPGDAPPDQNAVRAGFNAAVQFLCAWETGSCEVVRIPAHATLPISVRRISPKEVVSGLCRLELLDGPGEIQVRADALPAFDLQGAWYAASLSSTPWREVSTHPINDYDRALSEPSADVFPDPNRDQEMLYTFGGRPGYTLIGQRPIPGEGHTKELDGNYGVIYRIEAEIKNPTSSPADVDLVFEASAGYTAGLFLIDGKLVRTRLLGTKGEARLETYHVLAGGSRTVDIVTLPLAGSSYPATLFLRPSDGAGHS